MTIGKTKNGGGEITLSKEEFEQFLLGTPIIKTTSYSKGIVEVELNQVVVCPSADTRAYLRGLFSEYVAASPAKAEKLTVADILNADFVPPKYVINDLHRVHNNLGNVCVKDIMQG